MAPTGAAPLYSWAVIQRVLGQREEALNTSLRAMVADPNDRDIRALFVDLVEWGPLGASKGLEGAGRLMGWFARWWRCRCGWSKARSPAWLSAGRGGGLFGAAALVRQSGRLKLEEQLPGSWKLYTQAARDQWRALPWWRRAWEMIDPRP